MTRGLLATVPSTRPIASYLPAMLLPKTGYPTPYICGNTSRKNLSAYLIVYSKMCTGCMSKVGCF